ncbi:Fe2+-dependent dioxygenase [Rhodanobacter sp. Si-c]|uniref:Fe2+-dependent dioxygenase n=1 Tax=Rhodanobacter lycopersici TaxID=3162487 RepID=A0ABV3QF40_9GAMM
MLLHIPQVLTADEVSDFRARLAAAGWADGRLTAGYQSARAKHNLQLPESDPVAQELGAQVRAALNRSALFLAAALPRRVFPPLFNGYRAGDGFGNHVDNAVRYDRSGPSIEENGQPVRTDLSATLFLSSPEDYDGGELLIEELLETRQVKLPAGDLVLYPATSVHRVQPITRGARMASFFWIQSLVRDVSQRSLLFNLDMSIQKLERDHAGDPTLVELVGTYHNLLRFWTDV